MAGIGLVVMYLGYAMAYWALQSIQGKPQTHFVTYLLPFASGAYGTDPFNGKAFAVSSSAQNTQTKNPNPPKNYPPNKTPGGAPTHPGPQ